jgi:hypothetical protein
MIFRLREALILHSMGGWLHVSNQPASISLSALSLGADIFR